MTRLHKATVAPVVDAADVTAVERLCGCAKRATSHASAITVSSVPDGIICVDCVVVPSSAVSVIFNTVSESLKSLFSVNVSICVTAVEPPCQVAVAILASYLRG